MTSGYAGTPEPDGDYGDEGLYWPSSGQYFTRSEDRELRELKYEPPAGYALVGFWCWRGSGHICDESCKSDSVPLFAQAGWAAGVRRNIQALYEESS